MAKPNPPVDPVTKAVRPSNIFGTLFGPLRTGVMRSRFDYTMLSRDQHSNLVPMPTAEQSVVG